MKNDWFKLLLFIILILVLYISRIIVLATLIGIGIGVILSPLLDTLQKRLKLKRTFGAIFLILSFLAFFTLLTILFGQILIDQTHLFVNGIPEFSVKFRENLLKSFLQYPWILEQINDFDFVGTIKQSFTFLFHGTQSGIVAISGVLFAFIIGLYLAIDRDYYFNGLVRAFVPQYSDIARDTLMKSAHVIRNWFKAQLIDMAIIGVITTIGLSIIGVKYWALFGLLTALLGIIPYVGIMIVVVIVTLITLATDASHAPWVLLVFFITQQIEGNIVLPMVMKGKVEIPEALLIIVMLFFGFWFGLIGIFIAPPLVAVGIFHYRRFYIKSIHHESLQIETH